MSSRKQIKLALTMAAAMSLLTSLVPSNAGAQEDIRAVTDSTEVANDTASASDVTEPQARLNDDMVPASVFPPDEFRADMALHPLIYDEQEPLIRAELARLIRASAPAMVLGAAQLKAGQFYRAEGNYLAAEEQFAQALASFKKAGASKEASVHMRRCMQEIAETRETLGKLTAARGHWKDLLNTQPQEIGTAIERVRLLGKIASLDSVQQRHIDAQKIYEQSLQIEEQMFGKEHLALAATLHDLAQAHESQKNLETARALFERKLKLEEKSAGDKAFAIGTTLIDIGRVSLKQYHCEESLAYYDRALKIYRAHGIRDDDPLIADIKEYIARVYDKQGMLAQAQQLRATIVRRRLDNYM